MSENLLQTLQHVIQDVIAPDVRELKVRMTCLEQQMGIQFNALNHQFDSFSKKSDAQYLAILAAISESKAQTELMTVRLVSALSERVAVLESRHHS